MKIYAEFDPAGALAALYPEDIYFPAVTYGPAPEPTASDPDPVAPVLSTARNAAVPADAVEITEDQARDLIANPGLRKWSGEAIVNCEFPAAPAVVPDQISRRQFFMQAAAEGDVTEDEAIAAMAGTLPQEFEAMIAQLPAAQQFAAKMSLAGQTFLRSSPFTAAFGDMTSPPKTAAQLDAFWLAAYSL